MSASRNASIKHALGLKQILNHEISDTQLASHKATIGVALLYTVREFDEKDIETVLDIISEAFTDEISRGMPTPTAEKIIEGVKRSGFKWFVCETKERGVAGFLSMIEGGLEHPAQIHLVAVKSEYRRKGIGKALIKRAIEHAKNLRINKIKVFVRPWNTSMRKVCAELNLIPEAYLRKEFLNEDLILYVAFL